VQWASDTRFIEDDVEHKLLEFFDPAPEHAAASSSTSERAVVVLFLKLLVIIVLPLSTSTVPPSERAATIDLDPTSL
jgi:hypothetical protein